MNVLLLQADEFRHDAAGFAGNAVARTPHLDRLAAGARIFTQANTPAPVCVPARQCFATGKYAHQIGCERFGDDLAPGAQTFARWFTAHGYYTVACGKLHHRGPDQMQGWMHRIGAETAVRWPEKFADRPQIGRRKWTGAADVREAGVGESPLAIHDDYTVRGVEDFLRLQAHYGTPPEVPVFLMVSLQQPHFPLRTDADKLAHYEPRVPVFWNQPAAGHPELDRGRLGPDEGITETDVRRATATYYGMVETTDARIGRVVAALEAAGHDLNQWLIVFTSDHGEMLGEHGVWEKRKFYDGSVKVPLFLRGPGVAPGTSDVLCNLVDLFPTLTALAGLPTPDGLSGENLLATDRADRTFSQYDGTQFMIREGNWKYQRYARAPEVLFDLAADPGETRNRAGDADAAGVLAELRHRLDTFIAPPPCTATQNGPS
jgi:choline-sulfatase